MVQGVVQRSMGPDVRAVRFCPVDSLFHSLSLSIPHSYIYMHVSVDLFQKFYIKGRSWYRALELWWQLHCTHLKTIVIASHPTTFEWLRIKILIRESYKRNIIFGSCRLLHILLGCCTIYLAYSVSMLRVFAYSNIRSAFVRMIFLDALRWKPDSESRVLFSATHFIPSHESCTRGKAVPI